MVWPILISVGVTPRISAANDVAGIVASAIALSAASPADTRIVFAPHHCSPLRLKQPGRFSGSRQNLPWLAREHQTKSPARGPGFVSGSTLDDHACGCGSRPASGSGRGRGLPAGGTAEVRGPDRK